MRITIIYQLTDILVKELKLTSKIILAVAIFQNHPYMYVCSHDTSLTNTYVANSHTSLVN